MADDQTKDALGTAVTWLGGTGVLAAFGVFMRGVLTGTTGQEAEVRKALQEENKRLRARARYAMDWEDHCRDARREAERLGFDAAKWPPDPKEEDE
ncbi:hypothetical protein Dxin01_02782 [Deinococcus xinjiangensis]|uniref:Uncharacterized protein n=1 Tax=Deinococcus xinjiangensis TaxID=457454 RepID=A0ABP9VI40_9DEIO